MPPVVSIITVVFNGAPLLEGTIRSVLEQTCPDIEHIVVDGGSTDGTLDIIRRRAAHPSSLTPHSFRWLSEPDRGLYDAMNKGLRMASGDFVWFLNAGDQLFEKDTVEKLARLAAPDTDVLFGEVMLVDILPRELGAERRHLGTRSALTTQKLPESLDWKSLRMGMVVCHQAFVARRSLAPLYIEGNLAADIDWVISVLKKSRKTVHTHLVLAEYLVGGISKKRRRRSLLDRFEVLKKHYGWLPNLWNHVLILARAAFAKKEKRL